MPIYRDTAFLGLAVVSLLTIGMLAYLVVVIVRDEMKGP